MPQASWLPISLSCDILHVSAIRCNQANDLPDELWTKVNIELYSDTADGCSRRSWDDPHDESRPVRESLDGCLRGRSGGNAGGASPRGKRARGEELRGRHFTFDAPTGGRFPCSDVACRVEICLQRLGFLGDGSGCLLVVPGRVLVADGFLDVLGGAAVVIGKLPDRVARLEAGADDLRPDALGDERLPWMRSFGCASGRATSSLRARTATIFRISGTDPSRAGGPQRVRLHEVRNESIPRRRPR